MQMTDVCHTEKKIKPVFNCEDQLIAYEDAVKKHLQPTKKAPQ